MSFFDTLLSNANGDTLGSVSDAVSAGDFGGLFNTVRGLVSPNPAGAIPQPTRAAVASGVTQGSGVPQAGAYPVIPSNQAGVVSGMSKTTMLVLGAVAVGLVAFLALKK